MTWQFATKMSGFETFMYATVYKLLYYLNIGVCWLVDLFYNIFDKLGGLCKAAYQGDADLLYGLLFSNGTVSGILWCMAIVCVVLAAVFAGAVIVRRNSDKSKMIVRPLKQVLRSFGKTAVVVLSMTLAIVILLNATGILMQQAQYAWIDAEDAQEKTVTFSDEEFAAMARVLNTIGNFSLNPTYNNRYNINSCFNEIRPDMQYLAAQGVFRYNAEALNDDTIVTWQSALQKIADTGLLSRELKIDLYYEDVSNAILEMMELMRTNGTFKPLENYKLQHKNPNTRLPVDRAMFLTATLSAAKNEDLNTEPTFNDSLRYSYYFGEKSIYDLDAVNEGFDIGKSAIEFLIFTIGGLVLLKSLLVVIWNFVARLFNMLMLYFLAVPTLADGNKANVRKWAISFALHATALLAMIVLMRVILIVLPLIITADISIFSHYSINAIIKLLLLVANLYVAEKLSCWITRKMAGYESLHSVFISERQMGKRSDLLTIKAAAKYILKLTKSTLPTCAFYGEREKTEEEPAHEPEEEVPCDAVILQKFNSWTNP